MSVWKIRLNVYALFKILWFAFAIHISTTTKKCRSVCMHLIVKDSLHITMVRESVGSNAIAVWKSIPSMSDFFALGDRQLSNLALTFSKDCNLIPCLVIWQHTFRNLFKSNDFSSNMSTFFEISFHSALNMTMDFFLLWKGFWSCRFMRTWLFSGRSLIAFRNTFTINNFMLVFFLCWNAQHMVVEFVILILNLCHASV